LTEKEHKEKMEKMEKTLNESDLIDTRLKKQIKYVQDVRRDTIDAISNSETVVKSYHSAHQHFKMKLENRQIEHLGNENFIKGVIKNDFVRKRESIDMSKDVWKELGNKKKRSPLKL
jgi:hypothetical protein